MKAEERLPASAPVVPSRHRTRGLFAFICLCVLGLATLLGTRAPAAGAADACPNEVLRAEQGSAFLPDCRAWELVSPPDKNGGDVLPKTRFTQAAEDGEALKFASLVASSDLAGMSTTGEYIARRTAAPGTPGWSTHGITPRLEPVALSETVSGLLSGFLGALGPDLDRGAFLSNTVLNEDDPNVAAGPNLYLRSGLLAGSGDQALASRCPACASPLDVAFNQFPVYDAASDDFGTVLFESKLNLADDPAGNPLPSGTQYPKLYKYSGGAVSLVGVLPGGAVAACNATNACAVAAAVAGRGGSGTTADTTISADGSRVFFTTPVEKNGQGNASSSVYMRDDHGTPATADDTTTQLNLPDPGAPADTPQAATFWYASADGSLAYFSSTEALTDDATVDTLTKLYRWSLTPDGSGHHLTLVSENQASPGTSVNSTGVIGISEDGSYAYFIAGGQLAADGPSTCTSSNPCIFVWHDDDVNPPMIHEVGQVLSNTEEDFLLQESRQIGSAVRVSPNGQHLVFQSESSDLPGDNGSGAPSSCHVEGETIVIANLNQGCAEVYVFDATAAAGVGELDCASCPSGGAANGDAGINISAEVGGSGNVEKTYLNRAVTDDGRYVFFSSAEALVPQDTNGKIDAYEYDTQTGTARLLSSGTSSSDSYFMDAGADGRDAFILTRQRLSGWDVDESYDLYDARVGGGFPEPPPAPLACEGESCRPPATAPPPAAGSLSATLRGIGNAKPGAKPRHHRRCAKGKRSVRRGGKTRCIRKHHRLHHHKRKNKHHRINTDRRAGR